jgi:hypothetical protein
MGKKWIKFFNEINSGDVILAGGKGANLGELVRAGFSVPPGFCVTTEAYVYFLEKNKLLTPIGELSSSIGHGSAIEASGQIREIISRAVIPDDLKAQIVDAIKRIGEEKFYAIRSSATGEDLLEASFAGQLESYLNINGEFEILNKIRDCWASLYTERAILYRIEKEHVKQDVQMAVVVQTMVFSEKSGVMFTADPITGDRDIISINASYGLGEAIVSGIVSADLYLVDKNNLKLLNKNIASKEVAIYPVKNVGGSVKKETLTDELKKSQALSNNKIIELAEIGKRVENHYGKPQDIEWAIEGNRIFITQARPITALPDHREWQAPSPGLWLRHFRLGEWLGEPVTPLFETWLLEHLEEQINMNFERAIHLPNHKPYHVVVNGWYFATGNFLPKNFFNLIWLGLRYMIPALIFRPHQLSILFISRAHWGMKFYEREWRDSIAPSYQQAVERGEEQIEKPGYSSLIQIIDSVAKAAGDNFYSFIAVGGSAWKPEMMLAEFYRKHFLPRRVSSESQKNSSWEN